MWHLVEERPARNSLLWSTSSWQTVTLIVETAPGPLERCPRDGYSPSGKQHFICSLNLSNFSLQSPDLVMLHSLDSRALVTSQGKMETMTSSFQSFLKPLSTSIAPPSLTPLGWMLLSFPPFQAFMVPPVHYPGPHSRPGIGGGPLLSQI